MPDWRVPKRNDPSPRAAKEGDNAAAKRDRGKQDRHDRVEKPPKQTVTDMTEYLTLFRRQKLEMSGDIFCKVSKFLRSRRHYCELRGCTLVVYKNKSSAIHQRVETEAVLAVVLLTSFKVEILQTNDNFARIFFNAPARDSFHSLYVKVTTPSVEFQQWRHFLSKARSVALPSLYSLSVESIIGQGGGGKVFMVRWAHDNQYYALKVINKNKTFLSTRAIRHVASERFLMEEVGKHPFLLRMEFAFQTQNNLFIGTQLCSGGDLATYIRKHGARWCRKHGALFAPDCEPPAGDDKEKKSKKKYYGRLSEEATRLAAAEIMLGLEHLHKRGIVYRDLKPENVLIDADGHLKIGDFGLAKYLRENTAKTGYSRTGSICGTRNYLPPEMLYGRQYSMEADMWSLGVMLYRMMCGCFPFDAARTKEVFHMVRREPVKIPKVLSFEARSLLLMLLHKDPQERMTVTEAMTHPFFASIDWDETYHKRGGVAIKDLDPPASPAAALENFEVGRLQGVTIGEYVSQAGDLKDNVEDAPLPNTNPRGRLMGFEYSLPDCDEKEPDAIDITRKNGLLGRIVSIDTEPFNLVPKISLTPRQGSPDC